MKIIVKNKILKFKNKEIQCSIGKNGFTSNKIEGDGCTPIGTYKLREIFFRKDKISLKNEFLIKNTEIRENSGWCDDIKSEFYNCYIDFPFEHSAERLYRVDNLYDIFCVIEHNMMPIIKNNGSAIFLHVASKQFDPTEGCIAIEKKYLIEIAEQLDATSQIVIEP